MNLDLFEVPSSDKPPTRLLLEERERYSLFDVTFESPLQTDYPENDTVHCFHYRPHLPRNQSAIVVFHGWLTRRAPIERKISEELSEEGWNVFLFHLPFHLKRTPAGRRSGEDFLSNDLEKTCRAFHQAILDSRRLADFLVKDGFRIGGMGLSMGAILLNLIMGVERRYEAGVSIVGGGDLLTLLRKGWMGRWVVREPRWNGMKWEDHKIRREHHHFLSQIEGTGRIPEPSRDWFLFDPLTFAHRNRPRHVLMFNGLFDPIVPRSSVLKLTRRLGIPKPIWLPTEHFSILIFMPYILKKSKNFFEKALNSP